MTRRASRCSRRGRRRVRGAPLPRSTERAFTAARAEAREKPSGRARRREIRRAAAGASTCSGRSARRLWRGLARFADPSPTLAEKPVLAIQRDASVHALSVDLPYAGHWPAARAITPSPSNHASEARRLSSCARSAPHRDGGSGSARVCLRPATCRAARRLSRRAAVTAWTAFSRT